MESEKKKQIAWLNRQGSNRRPIMNRLFLAVTGAFASVASFASTTGGGIGYEVDYTDAITGFGGYIQALIEDNMLLLLGILALVVGFGFIWYKLRSLGRSI